mgnify:CR=1 FL=1
MNFKKGKTIREILDLIVDFVFYFSLVILILTFGAKKFVFEKKLSTLEKQIESFKQGELKELEKEYLKYKAKFDALSKIFSEMAFPSKALSFLEENTLPTVKILQFEMNLQKCEGKIQAKAPDLPSVQQQIDALKRNEKVKNAELAMLKSEKGEFNFEVVFTCDEKILK